MPARFAPDQYSSSDERFYRIGFFPVSGDQHAASEVSAAQRLLLERENPRPALVATHAC